MEDPFEMFTASRRLIEMGLTEKALGLWMRWLVLPSPGKKNRHLRTMKNFGAFGIDELPQESFMVLLVFWHSDFNEFGILPYYFELLLQALRQSEHSNLQKYCLAILRVSVSRFKEDYATPSFKFQVNRKQEYVEAYERYCNLFETIVMGRYINQVQECMAQLPKYTKNAEDPFVDKNSEPLVHEDWWLLLYMAALKSSNEQIRWIVGSWLLQNYRVRSAALGASGTYDCELQLSEAAFLDSLLTWAMHGQLLTKTIHRDGLSIRCYHGEVLTLFCSKLSQQSFLYNEWMITWLSEHAKTLNQHATAYVLQGIAKGTGFVTYKAVKSALLLSSDITFSPFQTLMVRQHCRDIVGDIPESFYPPGYEYYETIESLQNQIDASSDVVDGDAASFVHAYDEQPTSWEIREESEYRIYERLKSLGYLDRSNSWAYTINWGHAERYDPSQATWKLIAESWPHWVNQMLRDAVPRDTVRDFAGECVCKFFELSKRKIILWNSTARSLRKMYLEILPDILQYSHLHDAIIKIINELPSPTPEYLLDNAVASHYRSEMEDEQSFPVYADETVGHACVFDMLLRLRNEDIKWGQQLLDKLLVPWLNQKEPVPIVSKWKRTSQLQAMVILVVACLRNENDDSKKLYWPKFLTLLANEPNPHYRFLIEWILLHLCYEAPLSTETVYLDEIFETLQSADPSNPNPKLVASLIKIAVQLVMNARLWGNPNEAAPQLELLLSILTTLIASPRIPIKFEAQASFPIVYKYATKHDAFNFIRDNKAFWSLNKFIMGLDKYKNLPESRILTTFNVPKDINLTTLFEGGYLYSGQPETPLLRSEDFKEIRRKDSPEVARDPRRDIIPLGDLNPEVKALISTIKKRSEKPDTATRSSPNPTAIISNGPLQTKSFHLDLSSLDLEDSRPTNTGPILIGSLLETPINLGGLSRAANVFGCHSLHIPTFDLLKNPQFKNVSVDSELHISIEATPASELLTYLQSAKKEGWTVVGLEQTDSSITIGMPDNEQPKDKKLPKKAIIVMGAEKTGIPADILLECDLCIEIKQWGITRSLNVQTAAACILFEWRREWGDGSEPVVTKEFEALKAEVS